LRLLIYGVFNTHAEAEKTLRDLRDSGLHVDRTTLLTPGSDAKIIKEMQDVPQDSSEQPGMGGAMGALLGGGVGFASGSVLLALVPGLGPVTAVGLLGASILAAAGATLGLQDQSGQATQRGTQPETRRWESGESYRMDNMADFTLNMAVLPNRGVRNFQTRDVLHGRRDADFNSRSVRIPREPWMVRFRVPSDHRRGFVGATGVAICANRRFQL
jgi:hypothetical protein